MTSLYNKLLNNCFVIAFSIILLLVALNHFFIYIFLLIYLIYIYKNDKTIFKIDIVIIIIIITIYYGIQIYQKYTISNLKNNYITGKIIAISKKTYYQKITIKNGLFKINIYDYDFENVKLGMVIEVQGEERIIEENHIPNAFNYKEYFYNSLYIGEFKKQSLEIKKQSFSINIFNDYMKKYLEKYFKDESLIILKAFIIGDNSCFEDSLKEAIKTNGIVHLFALSGLHISLFISMLEKVLKNFKKKELFINIFLFIYLLITKFGISISRAICTYYLKMIFNKLNLHFTSLDRTSIVFIVFTIINPYLMYNNGFVLSFFATFIILLISNKIKNVSEIKVILIISLFTNILMLPIMVNINNEFNILTFIINIIMILLVEMVVLPLSIIVCIFPVFNVIYIYIIKAFILIIEIQANISYSLGMVIVLKTMDFKVIVLYYLLIYYILSNHTIINIKKKVFLYILFLLIININITSAPTITFLDLYNGESTLIEYKDEVILIDTGEGINNEVTTFLKSKGIRTIDYMFITHNHSDHNGEIETICKHIKVKKVIKNIYDKNIYHKNTISVKQNDIIKTKYFEFEVLNPINNDSNENNNSLVLYVNIMKTSFLFLGDIEKEVEQKLDIKKRVDIIKVAHHGSNTSTTIDFLNMVKPKYAIIMNGRSEVYSFPSPSVLSRLKEKNIKTYTTKNSYTIILKVKKDKVYFYETKKEIILKK